MVLTTIKTRCTERRHLPKMCTRSFSSSIAVTANSSRTASCQTFAWVQSRVKMLSMLSNTTLSYETCPMPSSCAISAGLKRERTARSDLANRRNWTPLLHLRVPAASKILDKATKAHTTTIVAATTISSNNHQPWHISTNKLEMVAVEIMEVAAQTGEYELNLKQHEASRIQINNRKLTTKVRR